MAMKGRIQSRLKRSPSSRSQRRTLNSASFQTGCLATLSSWKSSMLAAESCAGHLPNA